jgi:hypothetical protein
VYLGPKIIPDNIIGTKENPIVNIGVLIDNILDNTIVDANNKLAIIIFLILFIKPSF